MKWSLHVRRLAIFSGVIVFFASVPSGLSATKEASDVSKYVEGVYALDEWHSGSEVLRPPAIEGRFVLRDGVVVTVLKNSAQPASKVNVATYGKYTLEGSDFSYSYEDLTLVTETPTENKVSHKLLFDGTRTFAVSLETDGVHFRRAEGKIEFLFNRAGLTYSEDGKVLRVWRRLGSD